MQEPIRVGITHGDINGISYEVILKTLDNEMLSEICTPVLFGSSKLIGYYRKVLGLDEVLYHQVTDEKDIRDNVSNLVNITDAEFKVEMGHPTAESGHAAYLSLQRAIKALRNGDIDILVTGPISKEAMKEAGFPYPGHTEYLQAEFGDETSEATMILCDDTMRVALMSTHLPIKDVASYITKDKLKSKIVSLNKIMERDFNITKPRIAVLALNPHCGDNGVCGTEEDDIIRPVIEECVTDNILAFGPFAADGFFGSGAYKKYDVILAMYHDQGLIPFKSLRTTSGVNFTAGLDIIRTSPDHGTAYDITGRGQADPQSLRNAIYRGIDLFRNRLIYDRVSMNPIKKQYVERGKDKTVDLTKEELTAE